jgi:hypothetical protein
MRTRSAWAIIAFVSIITILGTSQAAEEPTIVNLMISTGVPPSATAEEAKAAELNLVNMYTDINSRNLVATIFSTQDLIDTRARIRLTRMGLESEFEFAMSGKHADEKLSQLPYLEQYRLLETSKTYVESNVICGTNVIIAKGFMPQSFDQNQDTYEALDGLGIEYSAGFQAGLLYEPGHENDVWPYPVEGHNFYAVPVSTRDLSGERVVLHDSYFSDGGMDADQWYDALVGKFEEIQGKDEPMVVSLTTSVSGSGDYLDALNRFMDYAISQEATFVTTIQLVDMTKAGVRDVSELPEIAASEVCPECDEDEEGINATIRVIDDIETNATEPQTS